MIPFNANITSFEDVKKIYPKAFSLKWLNNKKVKVFVAQELQILIDERLYYCELDGVKPDMCAIRQDCIEKAQAKAIYHFLWAVDHITWQMATWHWKQKDLILLIGRMERAGYDPYSTTDDTAGKFIGELHGHGFKKIKTADSEFIVYDPREC